MQIVLVIVIIITTLSLLCSLLKKSNKHRHHPIYLSNNVVLTYHKDPENIIIKYYDNGTCEIIINNTSIKSKLTDQQIRSILYFVNNLSYLKDSYNDEETTETIELLGKIIDITDNGNQICLK